MDPLDLSDDAAGYLPVQPPGGGPFVPLDLYAANNAYVDLSQAHPGPEGATARLEGFRDYLAGAGLPGLSLRSAAKAIDAVVGRVEALGKVDSGSPTTPG